MCVGVVVRFCKLIRRDDILVAYSNKTVYGIAEVKGGPFHIDVKGSNALYANRRKVNWLVLLNQPVSGSLVHFFSMPRDTIHEITHSDVIDWVWSRIQQ
jgi:hypothetical protein